MWKTICPNPAHTRCYHICGCCGNHEDCRTVNIFNSKKLSLGTVYGNTIHEIENNARKQAAEFFCVLESDIVLETDSTLSNIYSSSDKTKGRYYAYVRAYRRSS